MAFITRTGKFDYNEFVKSLAMKCESGQVLSPRCSRETFMHGNPDKADVAMKKLRFAFETIIANRVDFKRKRSDAGGYEYLKL
ncbi:hypothetical protein GCM10011607_11880 [Shewanella inventionis]|uniref:Uncharacterized protein n=1 Tax=Shewanella inventionis TaxID=1738770 RepID=A0ABQ1IWR2_9GAMM|nr:hypothetical protein [Shewanella inventionis]GGB53002.1 hypothetical protein GCM10011607_11880 [Shewanella inventionis]